MDEYDFSDWGGFDSYVPDYIQQDVLQGLDNQDALIQYLADQYAGAAQQTDNYLLDQAAQAGDIGGFPAPEFGTGNIPSVPSDQDKYSFKADYGAPKQDRLGLKASLDETAPGYALNVDTPDGVSEETGTGLQMPTAPNLSSMGGGQGLTLDIPAQYDSDGNLIPGTGGVLTEKGFVPGNAQRVLGDPRSYINNPTVTGRTQVTNDSIRTPITPPNTRDIQNFVREATKSTGNATIKDILSKATQAQKKPMDMMSLLPLLLAMMAANKQQPSTATIPSLGASRSALPYTPPRAGERNISYFSPVTYRAAGGIAGLNSEYNLGGYSDGGRLLKGPGDGVSDDIPATIGGKQPARLADGEFVVPARIVSELGNGSTDAGARKLYDMMKRVEQTRKKGKGIAQDTKADRHLPA